MNREILFKAKPKNWRQQESENYWVEGYYSQLGTGDNIVHYICQNMALCKLFKNETSNMYFTDVEIDPSTLCQFTGMTDKKRKKVWENDIVKVHIFHEIAEGYGNHVNEQGVLCYDSIGILSLRTSMYENIPCYSDILMQAELAGVEIDVEVIGNVFDNPELLEERAQYESV